MVALKRKVKRPPRLFELIRKKFHSGKVVQSEPLKSEGPTNEGLPLFPTHTRAVAHASDEREDVKKFFFPPAKSGDFSMAVL